MTTTSTLFTPQHPLSLMVRCSACSVFVYLIEAGAQPPYDFDPYYGGCVWVPSPGTALVMKNGRGTTVPFCMDCGAVAGRLAQQGRPANLTVLDWARKLSRAQSRTPKEAALVLRAVRREADEVLRARSPFRAGLLDGLVFKFEPLVGLPEADTKDSTSGTLAAYDLIIRRLVRYPDEYGELTSPPVPEDWPFVDSF
ncbi:MAG: hypothetical protein JNJ54_04665 [Myxococcaceae bacterium]|nr:hypothetical protein [Myxococcaceae bacterium]